MVDRFHVSRGLVNDTSDSAECVMANNIFFWYWTRPRWVARYGNVVTKGGVILARIAIATTIFMVFVVSLSPAASSDRNYFSLLIWVTADEGFATVGRVWT